MEETQAVLERMETVREETLRQLEALTQEALDRRPAVPEGDSEEAWSPGEIFMHLAIDEVYVRELIARPLLEGVKPPDGVRFLPPPPPHGLPKDVIRYWFERARALTRRLLEAWPEDANLTLRHEGGLREMNALEWLRGYAGHEELHQRQLDEMLSDQQHAEVNGE